MVDVFSTDQYCAMINQLYSLLEKPFTLKVEQGKGFLVKVSVDLVVGRFDLEPFYLRGVEFGLRTLLSDSKRHEYLLFRDGLTCG